MFGTSQPKSEWSADVCEWLKMKTVCTIVVPLRGADWGASGVVCCDAFQIPAVRNMYNMSQHIR
jgi:hypothetical protein